MTEDLLAGAHALFQAGALDEAAARYRAILEHGENPDALHGLGLIAWQQGRLDEAREHLQAARALAPGEAAYLITLGDIERMAGRLDAAEATLREALAIKPDSAAALNNMGMVYIDQARPLEAVSVLVGATQLDPGLAMAHYNLGIALKELNELDESIAAYRRAIALQPDFVQAHVNMAIALLLDGQLEEGFEEYEWRRRPPFSQEPARETPPWDGLVDPNGSLLLVTEQGIGDAIQFARYIPFIAREGMRVIVQCRPELEELLQSVEGVASTYRMDETPPRCSGWLPLMSLAHLFETRLDKIPRNVPYLQPPFGKMQHWGERLLELGETIKVGLRWAGNPQNTLDRQRSIPLASFAGLGGMAQVTFISLSDVPPAAGAEAEAARAIGLVDFSAELADLSDTAALVANLDLVISVDTAILHLAGALGRPTWGLVKCSPHWPWLLDRNDSPWYPSVQLFRQAKPGEWTPVVDRVVRTLGGAMVDASGTP